MALSYWRTIKSHHKPVSQWRHITEAVEASTVSDKYTSIHIGSYTHIPGNHFTHRINISITEPEYGIHCVNDIMPSVGTILIIKLGTLFSKCPWCWWFRIHFSGRVAFFLNDWQHLIESHDISGIKPEPGARPTKHISIEFEIRWKFRTL